MSFNSEMKANSSKYRDFDIDKVNFLNLPVKYSIHCLILTVQRNSTYRLE